MSKVVMWTGALCMMVWSACCVVDGRFEQSAMFTALGTLLTDAALRKDTR